METQKTIKVGSLISYDYMYIKEMLPRIYEYADIIVFALDKERKTWSGNTIDIPDSFFSWLKEFDINNKISLYEDNFYIPELSPMECEVRERNLLSKFMGEGGWHIQIDSDEYFIDFKSFTEYLKKLDITKPTTVFVEWIHLFKRDENGFYIIEPHEPIEIATNKPAYEHGRAKLKYSGNEKRIYTDFKMLHQSWARNDDEISFKINNWGHANDFNTESYFKIWQNINKHTYKFIQSFHPLDAWRWKYLIYFETQSISTLIEKVKERESIKK